jgi:hypothetical protein
MVNHIYKSNLKIYILHRDKTNIFCPSYFQLHGVMAIENILSEAALNS